MSYRFGAPAPQTRSHLVAIVMGCLTNPFYAEAIELLTDKMQQFGLLPLFLRADPRQSAKALNNEIRRYGADAVIIASSTLSADVAEDCTRGGVPVVLLGRANEGSAVSSVTGDNERGGRVIADLLVRAGHRRFGYLAGVEGSQTNQEREKGFAEGLARHGFAVRHREVGNFTYEGGLRAARRLLREEIDAVFCANDYMAFAFLETARTVFNVRVPDDVSVAGFDNVRLAGSASFKLTSFSQPVTPIIDEVVTMTRQLIDNPCIPARRCTVAGDLVIRGSTRLPAMAAV